MDQLTERQQTYSRIASALACMSNKQLEHNGYCNAHCRRNFYDLSSNRPELESILSQYGQIWANEATTKAQDMSAAERLTYHHTHSLPVMQALQIWAETEANAEVFEEHSPYGKAIKYLLRHFNELTQFCHVEGMPLDNNRAEERLKIPIRGRKLSHFHRTANGAEVANCLTSLIATADMAGVNVFDYLCALQRHRLAVNKQPNAWLPWEYAGTLAALEKQKAPPDKPKAA